jgi:hypothetical protein
MMRYRGHTPVAETLHAPRRSAAPATRGPAQDLFHSRFAGEGIVNTVKDESDGALVAVSAGDALRDQRTFVSIRGRAVSFKSSPNSLTADSHQCSRISSNDVGRSVESGG